MLNIEFYKEELSKGNQHNLKCKMCKTMMGRSECFKQLLNHYEECPEDSKIIDFMIKEHHIILTNAEKTILKNIDKKYNYIARDKNNKMFTYEEKPFKRNEEWYCPSNTSFLLFPFSNIFKFIKWEDEVPYSIEELLKIEII